MGTTKPTYIEESDTKLRRQMVYSEAYVDYV